MRGRGGRWGEGRETKRNPQLSGLLGELVESGKELTCQCRGLKRLGSIPWSGRSPEQGVTTHSSILAWRVPRAEEPGGLQSIGSQRIGHD